MHIRTQNPHSRNHTKCMHIRVREVQPGSYTKSSIFVGPDKDHLSLAGVLLLSPKEAQLLGAVLFLGSTQNDRLTVDHFDLYYSEEEET